MKNDVKELEKLVKITSEAYNELKRLLRNAKQRQYYQNNKELFKERNAKYKKDNREHWNDYQKKYKQSRYNTDPVYREKMLERSKNLYLTDPGYRKRRIDYAKAYYRKNVK